MKLFIYILDHQYKYVQPCLSSQSHHHNRNIISLSNFIYQLATYVATKTLIKACFNCIMASLASKLRELELLLVLNRTPVLIIQVIFNIEVSRIDLIKAYNKLLIKLGKTLKHLNVPNSL